MRLAVSIFKFLASLKLAIFLLVALAAVFAVGTFMESAYGTEAAQLVIYRSPFLNLLLIILALNLAAAVFDRLPWKKKHVGFVITHAGIILLLMGSLITMAHGLEGQMAIQENETVSRIILTEPLLQVLTPKDHSSITLPLKRHAFPWKGEEELFESPKIELLRYFPKASREEKIVESSSGPAGLKVILESSFMKTEHWLFLDDPDRDEIILGPAQLRFSRETIPLESQIKTTEAGFLEFRFENTSIQVPADVSSSTEIPLGKTPYSITILRVLRDARVEGNQLVDQSAEWKNPACELMLEGDGIKEKHTVFQKFPDFPTLHGMRPSQAGVRIFYKGSETINGQPPNELRFIWQENGLPHYQVKKGSGISEGNVILGEDRQTGWMDFRFRVEQYLPHAKVTNNFKEEAVNSQADNHLPAIELEIESQGERKTFWLAQGDQKNLELGGQSYEILYGFRTFPVGFRLKLRDFRIEHYPGTGQPASFESDVTLRDDFTGTLRDLTIRMNQPLKYRGFKVFQSGYQQAPDQPEISIFTVAKDPGIPLKYAGAIILIGGILTMFYTRRFSGQSGRQSQLNVRATPRGRPELELAPPGRAQGPAPALFFLTLFLGWSLLTGFSSTQKSAETILEKIPVQSGGRIKPFESFSREAVLSITGKSSFEKQDPTLLVWRWIAEPDAWFTKSFLPIKYEPLKKEFSLMVIGGNISPELVLTHAPFQEKVKEAFRKQDRKETLTFLERKRLELYNRARIFQSIAEGTLPGFFPNPEDPRAGWISLSGLANLEKRAVLEMQYGPAAVVEMQGSLSHLVQAVRDKKNVFESAAGFYSTHKKFLESKDIILDEGKIRAELFYNWLQPFHWVWILYLASGLLWFFAKKNVPMGLFLLGFAFHTLGFFLRCQIAGRPPVTNMYESIIWVAWGVVLFSIILRLIYRSSILNAAASWIAFLALLIGESFPALLDPTLAPLVPVLRSNYWLTLHVLTITLSYGAFAFAWGLAHMNLWNFSFRPQKGDTNDQIASYLYRALQIGVVLLAAGTILGGVWANESWGRFWGWDPKETWALIALFGYLIILHGRFSGWLGNFGTALGSILAFLGILMAWYGVNFVLAAGFHSYGFGGGGLPYVLAAVILDLIFVSCLVFRYNKTKTYSALS